MQLKTEMNQIQDQLIECISADQLMTFTRNISKEVRLSGSEEELRAFRYTQGVLDGYGFSTALTFHDALISLPGKAKLTVDGQRFECITHAMAAATDKGGMTGKLVFIDLEHISEDIGDLVNDAIAIVPGIATPGAVQTLETGGAIGAIFINGKHTHEMIVSTIWGNPTPGNIGTYPKISVVSVDSESGESIKSILSGNENVQAWMETAVDTGWRMIPTLIAEMKGEIEPDKFVMFAGHIDSWHYGAMDNATANATMLETARIFSSNNVKLHRSLRLAFWSGHSHGRYAGSAKYCDDHWEEMHENCALYVYIDSVGGKGANILGEPNVMAETKALGGSLVEKLTGESFLGTRYGRGADQSFWGTGVSSLFMGLSEQPISDDSASKTLVKMFGGVKSGGFGWWWHTTEDTIDKIDKDNLKRDCQIYATAVYQACASQILPLNQAASANELNEILRDYQKMAGVRLNLGLAIERTSKLEQLCTDFNQKVYSSPVTDEKAKQMNDTLMKLSRLIVPLNYVSGDIYDHDPAMNHDPLPMLSGIKELAEAEENTQDYHIWETSLTRKLNKVNHTLLKAIRVAEEGNDYFN